MTVYCVQKDGVVQETAFTSLKGACESAGVSYFSAVRGKRVFAVNGVLITALEIRKVSGRGGKRRNVNSFKKI